MDKKSKIPKEHSHPYQLPAHSISVLVHGLRVPAVALRACCERIRVECEVHGYKFSHDYLSDMETYCHVLVRLLQQFDILRTGADAIELNPRLVYILSTIVAPAIRFVRPLLIRRGFSPTHITHNGFHAIPRLNLDPTLLTQVVFNLLDNAIKYAFQDPDAFSVQIVATSRDSVFEIAVSDIGIGVDDESAARIFQPGFRGARSMAMNVTGIGLGLSVSRNLARRHQGDLILTNPRLPTTFTLVLPKTLMYSPSE